MMRPRFRTLFLLCLMIALPALMSPMGWPSVKAETPAEAPIQLTVMTAVPERLIVSDELPGRVAAWRRVEIRPQVGGLILERLVNEGTRVKAGDVLFRIDPAPLKADLATAEAGFARAVATEAHSRRGLARADALLAKDVISDERHEAARNDLALAEASLAEARAIVERRRLDVEFTTLRAPVAGYVAGGLADIGGLAVPGAERALAVVQDLDRVYVDLRLPAWRLDAVEIAAADGLGLVEIVTERGQTHPQQGRLKFSDVIVDPGTGNASVRVEVPNPDLALLPGMYVRARLPRGLLPDALLVPEDAILRSGGGRAQVVVVSTDGTATRRDVTLGDAIGGRVVVASGLSAGEVVAIRGQDRVPDGVSVPEVSKVAEDATDKDRS